MSKIKKVLLVLALLLLVFPKGAGAFDLTFLGGSAGVTMGALAVGMPGGSIIGIIGNIALWLLGLFAFFGIIGFTLSGIMYLISAGNESMVDKAKSYMTYSIVGVIVGLMGFVILKAAYAMLTGSPIF